MIQEILWRRETLKLYDFVFSNSPFEESEFNADFLDLELMLKGLMKSQEYFILFL